MKRSGAGNLNIQFFSKSDLPLRSLLWLVSQRLPELGLDAVSLTPNLEGHLCRLKQSIPYTKNTSCLLEINPASDMNRLHPSGTFGELNGFGESQKSLPELSWIYLRAWMPVTRQFREWWRGWQNAEMVLPIGFRRQIKFRNRSATGLKSLKRLH